MKIKRGLEDNLLEIFLYVFLTIFALLTLYPLWYVVMASFSSSSELMSHSGLLFFPLKPSLEAYKAILTYSKVWTGYKNTLILVVGGLGVQLVLTTIGAYFMSRKDIMLNRPITLLILFTMYFGGGMVPCYLNIRDLGLYDSLWAVILSMGLNTYNMIIMRTNFASIPRNIEESAEIDGANDLLILWKILLPLSTSIIAVMVLYYGVSNWNSWFNAMIYLNDEKKIPLQLVLRELLIQSQADKLQDMDSAAEKIDNTIKYAIIVVSSAPILMLYPFLQKYFVKGVMVGSVKG